MNGWCALHYGRNLQAEKWPKSGPVTTHLSAIVRNGDKRTGGFGRSEAGQDSQPGAATLRDDSVGSRACVAIRRRQGYVGREAMQAKGRLLRQAQSLP